MATSACETPRTRYAVRDNIGSSETQPVSLLFKLRALDTVAPQGSLLASMLEFAGHPEFADGEKQASSEECAPPSKPDGKVKLRAFDGTEECAAIPLEHECIVFGSTLREAHVADSTHASVKVQHAILLYEAPSKYFVQPLNGDVKLSGAAEHPAVSNALLHERRTAPRKPPAPTTVVVGSQPERLTLQHCCFTLGRSELVFFLDILPPADNIRRLGVARHLLGTFTDGRKEEGPRGRARAQLAATSVSDDARAAKPHEEETVAHNNNSASPARGAPQVGTSQRALPQQPRRNQVSPSRSRSRKRKPRDRSPSVWRNDKAKEGALPPRRLSEERRRERSARVNRQRAPSSSNSMPRRPQNRRSRRRR